MGDGADDAFDRGFDAWLDGEEDDEDCPSARSSRRPFYRWPLAEPDEWVTMTKKGPVVVKIHELEASHLAHILNYIVRKKRIGKCGKKRWHNLRFAAAWLDVVRGSDGLWREPHGFEKIA